MAPEPAPDNHFSSKEADATEKSPKPHNSGMFNFSPPQTMLQETVLFYWARIGCSNFFNFSASFSAVYTSKKRQEHK